MKAGGRKGRRTSEMVRIARERVDDLLALAEEEATSERTGALADRYVALARKVGMRYNVRLLTEYSEVYCRGCSTFWVEGRTVRTRIRARRRIRTCLRCGRVRRLPLHDRTPGAEPTPDARRPTSVEEGALTGPVAAPYLDSFREPGSEED